MKSYFYENWEIITDELLTLPLEKEKEKEKRQRIYAFRAPADATKCLTELNSKNEVVESLNQLYSKDDTSILAVNLSAVEQQLGQDSLKLFLEALSREQKNAKRKKKLTMLGLGDEIGRASCRERV